MRLASSCRCPDSPDADNFVASSGCYCWRTQSLHVHNRSVKGEEMLSWVWLFKSRLEVERWVGDPGQMPPLVTLAAAGA